MESERVADVDHTPTPVHDRAAREARGYSWERFRPGNWIGIKSGVGSGRLVACLGAQLAAALVAERPDLADPVWRFAVSSWARAETLAALLFASIDEVDASTSTLKEWRAVERRAAEERRNLGLDPSAAARLMRDRADAQTAGFDLQAAIAKGREVIDARSAVLDADEARAASPGGTGAAARDLTEQAHDTSVPFNTESPECER
jgi:hypothetical protein